MCGCGCGGHRGHAGHGHRHHEEESVLEAAPTRAHRHGEDPLQILKQRLAKGEITEAEYTRLRELLQ